MMKRAVFIITAVLAAALVFLPTTLTAKSPLAGTVSGPLIITPPTAGDNPAIGGSNDDGDADDLGGAKKGWDQQTSGSKTEQYGSGLAMKVWWNYLAWLRLLY